jgi:pimeloyl-ACP methyl ester carboxylesterase
MLDKPAHRQFENWGAAAPLLMLTGTLCDERMFSKVLASLRLAADIRPLTGATTTGGMAERILASAPPVFSLCGFSLGAIVALEIIARAPARVERLALIGCNPGTLDPATRTAREALTKDQFLAAATEAADPAQHALIDAMAATSSSKTYRQQTAMTVGRLDSRPRLSAIGVPTLVLCGAGDRTCPPSMSRQIAAAIPQARLVLVAGAGHYVMLQEPEIVATELAGWLAIPTQSMLSRSHHE